MIKALTVICILLFPSILFCQTNLPSRIIGPADITANAVSIYEEGGIIYMGTDEGLLVCDQASGELIRTVSDPVLSSVQALAISKDGSLLVAGLRNGNLIFYRPETGKSSTIECAQSQITSLDMVWFANVLIAGTRDGEVIRLDTTGQILGRYKNHNDLITRVELSPAGNILLSASIDGRITIMDLDKENINYSVDLKKTPAFDAALNLGIRSLITTGSNRVSAWILGYDYKRTLLKHFYLKGWVSGVDITPNGDAWAACSVNGEILVHTGICNYSGLLKGVTLNSIRFVKTADKILYLVVTTEGKGVRLVSTLDMKILQ